MISPTLEQRVACLEAELFRINNLLQSTVEKQSGIEENFSEPNWIDHMAGSISNEALFLEALEYGRQHRKNS